MTWAFPLVAFGFVVGYIVGATVWLRVGTKAGYERGYDDGYRHGRPPTCPEPEQKTWDVDGFRCPDCEAVHMFAPGVLDGLSTFVCCRCGHAWQRPADLDT